MSEKGSDGHDWKFLTNHGMVFLHLAEHPGDTIRQISDHLQIADRTTAGVLADLKRDGYISATKSGKQNVYTINPGMPLRRQPLAKYSAAEFFTLLSVKDKSKKLRRSRAAH